MKKKNPEKHLKLYTATILRVSDTFPLPNGLYPSRKEDGTWSTIVGTDKDAVCHEALSLARSFTKLPDVKYKVVFGEIQSEVIHSIRFKKINKVRS